MTARDVIAAHLSDMGFVSKGFVANHTTDRLLEALTAAGYAIVPVNPNASIVRAYIDADPRRHRYAATAKRDYRAMITAATTGNGNADR